MTWKVCEARVGYWVLTLKMLREHKQIAITGSSERLHSSVLDANIEQYVHFNACWHHISRLLTFLSWAVELIGAWHTALQMMLSFNLLIWYMEIMVRQKSKEPHNQHHLRDRKIPGRVVRIHRLNDCDVMLAHWSLTLQEMILLWLNYWEEHILTSIQQEDVKYWPLWEVQCQIDPHIQWFALLLLHHPVFQNKFKFKMQTKRPLDNNN